MSDERKLEVGMLLLGGRAGRENEALDTVYTVISVSQRGASVTAHLGSFNLKARLNANTLPAGWRIVDNKALARLLADLPRDHIVNPREQAAA